MVSGSLASISSLLLVAVIIVSGPTESEAIIDSFWNYFRAGTNIFDEGRNHKHQHQRDQSSEELKSAGGQPLDILNSHQQQQKMPCGCQPKMTPPVCGSNSVTYENRCEMECAKQTNPGLSFKHWGKCSESSSQPRGRGKFQILDTDLRATSEVQEQEQHSFRDCMCTLEYMPVCANNGMTYANKCRFKCAKKQQKGLKIRHNRECRM